MSGGPIGPCSAIPGPGGFVFPRVHVGGSNLRRVAGLGVTDATTLTADATWHLVFEMPSILPSGTCRLRLLALANATSGDAKVNPTWASVAPGENYDTITLHAEGVQTVTWAAAENDKWKEAKVTLDADTPVASELIYVQLIFTDSGYTLAVASTWLASIIFE